MCAGTLVPKNTVWPHAPPPEPSRETCGKNIALATPTSALAAMRFCSACRISGRRSSSAGQARRQLWRQNLSPNPPLWRLSSEGPSSRNALWVISEKNAERILGLTDLALQVRDLRIRSIEQLPGLKHVKPCGDTVFKPQLGEVD